MTRPPEAVPLSFEEPTPEELNAFALEAETVSDAIRPMLAGRPHQVQGAVLADLLATFIRGFHPPAVRDDVLCGHILGVIGMIDGLDRASKVIEGTLATARQRRADTERTLEEVARRFQKGSRPEERPKSREDMPKEGKGRRTPRRPH